MAELPDLIAITDGEPDWTWDVCIACESNDVTHRGLYIRIPDPGRWGASRIAWCAAEVCQADRKATVKLGQVIAVNADGGTASAWANP